MTTKTKTFHKNVTPGESFGAADIQERYPRAIRSTVRRCFPLCALTLLSTVLAASFGWYQWPGNRTDALVNLGSLALTFFYACATLLILRFMYELLYSLRYSYYLKRGNLVIEKGVLLREVGSFPLSKIAAIFVYQTPLDMLFALKRVHISSQGVDGGLCTWIDGLSPMNATTLKTEIEQLSQAYRILEAQNDFPPKLLEEDGLPIEANGEIRAGSFGVGAREMSSVYTNSYRKKLAAQMQ